MKKTLCILSILIVTIVIGFGCSRSSRRGVTLAGSTAFQPFAEKLAEIYMASHKNIRINVQGGGTAVGIQSALAGSSQIGMADLLELPPEAKVLKSTVVAMDGIAIIVNPLNAVQSLTIAQIKDVFTGKISNWKDIGGMDATIRVISREDGSGTRRSFDSLVLNDQKLSTSALFQNSNGTIREAVASDPNAIGYLSIGLVSAKVKGVQLNGVSPTKEAVKAKKYPLSRPIYFLTKAEISDDTKNFIDFVLSDEAQKILDNEGLIPVR